MRRYLLSLPAFVGITIAIQQLLSGVSKFTGWTLLSIILVGVSVILVSTEED